MTKDTTVAVDRLTAELTRVVRTTLVESLPAAEREEVRLRDLERVTRQAIQRIGQR